MNQLNGKKQKDKEKQRRHANENQHSILNDCENQEYENDNTTAKELGESIFLSERNNSLKVIAKYLVKACKIEKIANDSFQVLLAQLMCEVDKESTKSKRLTMRKCVISMPVKSIRRAQ